MISSYVETTYLHRIRTHIFIHSACNLITVIIPNNVSMTTVTVTVSVFVFHVTFSMNKHNLYMMIYKTWLHVFMIILYAYYGNTSWLMITYSIEVPNHLSCKISIACYHTKAVLLWHYTWTCPLKIRTGYTYCHSIGIRRWCLRIQFILSAV